MDEGLVPKYFRVAGIAEALKWIEGLPAEIAAAAAAGAEIAEVTGTVEYWRE